MGNNTTTKKSIEVKIEFDKGVYLPGDSITGKIHANVIEACMVESIAFSVNAKESVLLHVMEREKYQVEVKRIKKRYLDNPFGKRRRYNLEDEYIFENVTEDRFRTVRVAKEDSRILMDSEFDIYKPHSGIIEMGQYSIPFEFRIPEDLPGSFEYYDANEELSIKYILTVKGVGYRECDGNYQENLEDDTNNNTTEILAKSIFLVKQPEELFNYPQTITCTEPISSWCFFNQGTSTLKLSLQEKSYQYGNCIKVLTELDNTNCSKDASCINIELYQIINIKTKHGYKNFKRLIDKNYVKSNFARNRKSSNMLELEISDIYNPTRKNKDKCKHLYSYNNESILEKLQSSVKSDMIKCRYFLKLSVVHNTYFSCTNSPTVEIPVVICMPNCEGSDNFSLFDNWNPKMVMNYGQPNMSNNRSIDKDLNRSNSNRDFIPRNDNPYPDLNELDPNASNPYQSTEYYNPYSNQR